MTSEAVILKSPHDWDAWDQLFQAEAERKNLLDLVEGTETLYSKPTEPNFSSFLPKVVQTRASTRSSGASTNTEAAASIEPTTANLTTKGRASYQLAYNIYKDKQDQYEKQHDALDKLQT